MALNLEVMSFNRSSTERSICHCPCLLLFDTQFTTTEAVLEFDRVFHVILTKTITIFAGRCIDQVNNYTCSCDLGFEGRNCDVDIDYCKSSPCVHGKVFRNLQL